MTYEWHLAATPNVFLYHESVNPEFMLLPDLLAGGAVLMFPGVLLFWFVFHTNIARWRRLGTRAYWIACAVWPITWIPLYWSRDLIFHKRLFEPSIWTIAPAVVALIAAFLVGLKAAGTIPLRTLVG